LLTAAIAVGVLVVAFAGGAVSGKLEHTPSYRGNGSLPPVGTTVAGPAPSAASSPPPNAATKAKIQADLVSDMTLDIQAQRLDANRARRAAIAASPAAVAARHTAIAMAWVPAKVPILEAQYDQLVVTNAKNSSAPSVISDQFVVTAWSAITINGDQATAVLLGHYQLTEAPATVVTQPDSIWTVTLVQSDGRWRMQDRGVS
jgi:hypothetical protein